jgi:outer membrane biosynthesis protein TonB
MRTRWLSLAFLLGIAGGAAAAGPGSSSGLSGLDAELNGTGRVGAVSPGTKSQIDAPDGGATPAPEARPARPVAVTHSNDALSDPAATGARPVDQNEEYRQTEGRVAACRVEVARRRQVPPAKVDAGTVTVRFTVEPTGRVRDAEAVSASETDPEVAACAKRVLSEWVFARHVGKPVTVQRTYRLIGP